MKGVVLEQPVGEVWVVRGSQRLRAARTLALKDRDAIETGANSYVPSIHDNPGPTSGCQGSHLCLFPDTRVVLSIQRGLIVGLEISQGLAGAFTEKLVVTPTAEWSGSAWAEVAADGSTVVAASRARVRHRASGRVAEFTDWDGRQQLRVTADGIEPPEAMDQRFVRAQEIWENRGTFYVASLNGRFSASVAANEEKVLAAFESVAGRFGLDTDAVRESLAQQRQFLQTQADAHSRAAAEMQRADLGRAIVIPTDRILEHRGVALGISWLRSVGMKSSCTGHSSFWGKPATSVLDRSETRPPSPAPTRGGGAGGSTIHRMLAYRLAPKLNCTLPYASPLRRKKAGARPRGARCRPMCRHLGEQCVPVTDWFGQGASPTSGSPALRRSLACHDLTPNPTLRAIPRRDPDKFRTSLGSRAEQVLGAWDRGLAEGAPKAEPHSLGGFS